MAKTIVGAINSSSQRKKKNELIPKVTTGICRKGIKREHTLLKDPFHLSLKIEVDIVSCRVFHYLIR